MKRPFNLMDEVYVQTDIFNTGAPLGETGIIAKIDRTLDQAQPYCVRVPGNNEWYWMSVNDLVDVHEWISNEADKVIFRSLIDTSLDCKDEKTFRHTMESIKIHKPE